MKKPDSERQVACILSYVWNQGGKKSEKGDSISYSYIAVIKYHKQGNLQKEGIIGVYCSRMTSYHHHKGTCGNRQTWLLEGY